MKVETDFTSTTHTLVFETGKRVELTKEESTEFETWFVKKKAESEA